MPDYELEQLHRDAEFMMDTCKESRRACEKQREVLAEQRDKVALSRERQTEWGEKWATEEERLYVLLAGG